MPLCLCDSVPNRAKRGIMIITVTRNATVDKTVCVDDFSIGKVNRIRSIRLDASGKGVNVSRIIKRLSRKTLALGFLGGDTGRFIKEIVEKEEIETDFIEIEQPTRVNITVIDSVNKTETKINEAGHSVSASRLQDFKNRLTRRLDGAEIVVLSGSLPPGAPDDFYAQLITIIQERGAMAILDSDGQPLKEGVRANPFLIKPNLNEAEGLLGKRIEGIKQAIEALKVLSKNGLKNVVISMGEKGAVAYFKGRIFQVTPPKIEASSTVGSGDALVAGLAVGIDEDMAAEEGIKLAGACAAAMAQTPGTRPCELKNVERLLNEVVVKQLGSHSPPAPEIL